MPGGRASGVAFSFISCRLRRLSAESPACVPVSLEVSRPITSQAPHAGSHAYARTVA
jgi:hypothetical protein